ncbi:MAG TPA: transglycosylase domain-containing protein [Solirubrobacteraceae bacterium]|nr:transglycosylase domain-containing protein [Solirubrobacteraceae bacterium]
MIGIAALFGTIIVAIGIALGYVVAVADNVPPLSQLKEISNGANSTVYAADGSSLGTILSDTIRTPIPSAQIPSILKEATVAIEDQRFYQHHGVDFQGIIRAAMADLTSGKTLQGGSTITMQLVRNLYVGIDERTLKRKIKEAVLAERLEKVHNKDWILTDYLNTVPYGAEGGQDALGVQAAARIFFNRTAGELTLPQAALLAGLPQAPTAYNPFNSPAAAKARRNEVLAKMAQLGYITLAQQAYADSAPLGVEHGNYYSARTENFFFNYVQQQLIAKYGANTVLQGGLKVYTTLNLGLQHQAQKAMAEVLNQPGDPSAAIVTEDPHTGQVLAMAQSSTYQQTQYNLATEGHRQPGSTFKAIDLAQALSDGIDPDTTYYDSHYLAAGWLPGNPTYAVSTFGNDYGGSTNLVEATLKSDNTVYAQMAVDLGEKNITNMAYRLGVTTKLDSFPSDALGADPVTPIEMANVYATLADGGYRNTQTVIKKVVFPDGTVDASWSDDNRVQAVTDGVAAEETNILEQNVLRGTAVNSAVDCPTAAKTGTTSNLVDAWLDGYTPNYATVVWMGYPNKDVPMTDVHGEPQQGAALPATMWHDYMLPVVGTHCTPFPAPKQPLVYKPFTGSFTHVSSGGGGTGSAPNYTNTTPVQSTGTQATTPTKTKTTPQRGTQTTPGTTTPAGNGTQGGNGAGNAGGQQGQVTPTPPINVPTGTGNAGANPGAGNGTGSGTGAGVGGGVAAPSH